jgi:hypothetical protein
MTKRKLFFLIIIGLGIAVFILLSEGRQFFNPPKRSSLPSPANKDTIPTTEQVLARLEKEQKLTFPPILKEQKIDIQKLPQELRFLVDQSGQVISAKKVEYQNKKIGFMFNYTISNVKLKEYFDNLSQNFSNYRWNFVSGARGYSAFILEREKGNFQLRVVGIGFSPGVISVFIQALSK